MRQRLARVEDAAVAASSLAGDPTLFSRPSTRSRRRRQILQALLILNADRVAAEFIRNAQRRDIHSALIENLRVGQIGFRVRPGLEDQALLRRARHARLALLRSDTSRIAAYSDDWLRRSL